jgi:hypothetical protein
MPYGPIWIFQPTAICGLVGIRGLLAIRGLLRDSWSPMQFAVPHAIRGLLRDSWSPMQFAVCYAIRGPPCDSRSKSAPFQTYMAIDPP